MSVPIGPLAVGAVGATGASSGAGGLSLGLGSGLFDLGNSLLNAGFGIYDRFHQKEVEKQNQINWQTEFDYTKELNDTLMQREDNQYQRTVEDMRKAGLNPASLNGASTNTLSASVGSNGNSANAGAFRSDINPFSTFQRSFESLAKLNEDILSARTSRNLANAQAEDLRSQTALRDVERQIMADKLPESSFGRKFYEALSDEDIARLHDSEKRARLTTGESAEQDVEGKKLSNENKRLNNSILKHTMQDQIYKSQLEILELRHKIQLIEEQKANTYADSERKRWECAQINKEIEALKVDIENNIKRGKILNIDLEYSEKTKDELIDAINTNNKRSKSVLWNLYGSGVDINAFGVGVRGSNIKPNK